MYLKEECDADEEDISKSACVNEMFYTRVVIEVPSKSFVEEK